MSRRPPRPDEEAPGAQCSPDHEMLELVLLLPARQAFALERAARRQGRTAGQVLRRLVREFLAEGGGERRPGD
jgi:hypothetical protein